jgi:excisionase family DNA binding protein
MAENLTAQQAADMLGYHINHLYRLLKDGTVKGTRWGGKVWMIDRAEVARVKALQDEHGRVHKGQR